MAVQTGHPNFNPSTLANDIALLHLQHPAPLNGKYPSPVLTCDVVCVMWPYVISVTTLWASAHLSSRHPYDRFCYPQ